MSNNIPLLFIKDNTEYYSLTEVLGDCKNILSFGKDLLKEVKIKGVDDVVHVGLFIYLFKSLF